MIGFKVLTSSKNVVEVVVVVIFTETFTAVVIVVVVINGTAAGVLVGKYLSQSSSTALGILYLNKLNQKLNILKLENDQN